jgi:hypothetical protein
MSQPAIGVMMATSRGCRGSPRCQQYIGSSGWNDGEAALQFQYNQNVVLTMPCNFRVEERSSRGLRIGRECLREARVRWLRLQLTRMCMSTTAPNFNHLRFLRTAFLAQSERCAFPQSDSQQRCVSGRRTRLTDGADGFCRSKATAFIRLLAGNALQF